MNRFILTASIVSLTPRFLLAPPDDKGSGKPLSLEERLSKATDELTKVTGDLKTANDSLATLTKERDDAKSEFTKVKSQFDELTKTADKLKADLKTSQDTLEASTTDLNAKVKALTAANDNVGRLEKLCDVKGVARDASVPSTPEPSAKLTVADWETKMKSAKTPDDQMKVAKDFETAVAAGHVA